MCPEDIDNIICAQLFGNDIDPLAFEAVTKHMVHGSCSIGVSNVPCINGKTYYLYKENILEENYFVKYRHVDNSKSITICCKNINNEQVVPYNCDLCVKYDCSYKF